jgi:hypothetical protein
MGMLDNLKNKIQSVATGDSSSSQQIAPMSTKEKVESLIVKNPGIALKDDEICFFMADAYVGKQVKKTSGYKTSGLHASIHIMKGLSYRIGNTQVTPKQETYWEKIPCRFFVTGNRFIALAAKNGFDVKVDKILDMKLHSDGLILYVGNKTHFVFMNHKDVARYKNVWETLGTARREGIEMKDLL